MDTHLFVFAARRWIGTALVAGATLLSSLGFASVASADPQPVAARHAFVGHRVARHHGHGGEHGHRGGEHRGGDHRRGHGGKRIEPSHTPRHEPGDRREPRP